MHSIDDIYAIIHTAEKHEADGNYPAAYQMYLTAINAVDNDDDSFPFAGINPAPYDRAQEYASRCLTRVWGLLTDEEKATANNR